MELPDSRRFLMSSRLLKSLRENWNMRLRISRAESLSNHSELRRTATLEKSIIFSA